MEWVMRFTMKPLWFPMEIPMRVHILLEPAEKAGEQEKIFRWVKNSSCFCFIPMTHEGSQGEAYWDFHPA